MRETLAEIGDAEGIARRGLVLKLLTALKQITNHPAQYLGQRGPLAGRSGKLDAFDELLDAIVDAGDSVLVFTQYVAMGRLLEQHLASPRHRRHSSCTAVCAAARREDMVDGFQAGEVPVFLLSLKAGGTGLNLTRADPRRALRPWWNPAVEDQATDRAYRIGQDRPVQVHRLVIGRHRRGPDRRPARIRSASWPTPWSAPAKPGSASCPTTSCTDARRARPRRRLGRREPLAGGSRPPGGVRRGSTRSSTGAPRPEPSPRGRTYARQERVGELTVGTGPGRAARSRGAAPLRTACSYGCGSSPTPSGTPCSTPSRRGPPTPPRSSTASCRRRSSTTSHAAGIDLLPGPGEIGPRCSCPDWADPCKHAAAVCYLVADVLDHDPFELFHVRGRNRDAVLAALRARRASASGGRSAAPPPERRSDSVEARVVYARSPSTAGDLWSLAALPPLAKVGRPAPLPLEAPAASGISIQGLTDLAIDAAQRAWELTTGSGNGGLALDAEHDLARRAASLLGTPEFGMLATRAGVTPRRLVRRALAWRAGGVEGVDMLAVSWAPDDEALDDARDASRATGARPRAGQPRDRRMDPTPARSQRPLVPVRQARSRVGARRSTASRPARPAHGRDDRVVDRSHAASFGRISARSTRSPTRGRPRKVIVNHRKKEWWPRSPHV